jgi:iron complex outermembrane receptor protein
LYTSNILPTAGYLVSGTYASAKNEIWAVFGEATYGLTNKLDATFGLRYTEEDKRMSRYDTLQIPAAGRDTVTVLPEAGPKTFDDVSGTGSLTYQFTDDLMSYAKISKGYVSGGFNPRSPSPDTFGDGFDEESVWTYELGWKSTWWNDRLLVNGAIFYNDYSDLQVNVLTDEGRNNIANASDAELQGLELEIQLIPIDNMNISFGYGYLDSQFKDYIDPITGEDVSNINEFPQAPENTMNASGRYEVPAFLSMGDLTFRVDWSWVDDFFLLTPPGNEVQGYYFINGRVGLDNIRGPGDGSFSVALWGKNLTDELYYTSGYNLTNNLGFFSAAVGAPRTYGVDIIYEF